jgi:hypothetical protein
MTARELHDRLGRLLDERVIDADAEVLTEAGLEYRRVNVIDPVNLDPKKVAEGLTGDVSLCFWRLK